MPGDADNVIQLGPAAKTQRRELGSETTGRGTEGYVGEIFAALGMDLEHPGHARDAARGSCEAMFDATAGYDGDPKLADRVPRRGPRRHRRRSRAR